MSTYLLGRPSAPMTVLEFEDWRKIHPENFSGVVCPHCGGVGYSYKYQNECYRCEGAGELVDEKAARAVYDQERGREADMFRRLKR